MYDSSLVPTPTLSQLSKENVIFLSNEENLCAKRIYMAMSKYFIISIFMSIDISEVHVNTIADLYSALSASKGFQVSNTLPSGYLDEISKKFNCPET
jgi:hypothetical protein